MSPLPESLEGRAWLRGSPAGNRYARRSFSPAAVVAGLDAVVARRPILASALVFAGTVVLVLMFWMVAAPASRVDDGGDYQAFYEPVARRILSEGTPVYADGAPATRYPPGYPLLLAALFWIAGVLDLTDVMLLQSFALVATALCGVLLFWMARSVWPNGSALIAPILWGSCPFVLWLSALETSEMAFCVVFYASCWLFWPALSASGVSRWRLFATGILVGVAMLIRPIAIGVPVILAAAIWVSAPGSSRRGRLAAAGVLLAGSILAVGPWEVWVYQRSGRAILLSDGGVPSIRDGLTFATNLKGFRAGVAVPDDVRAVMTGLQARYDELRSVTDIGRAMWEQTQQYPAGVAKLLAIKSVRSWYGTDSHRLERPILAVQTAYLLVIGIGGTLAWRRGGASRRLAILVAVFTLYFWAMTVTVLSIVRYMVPALGLLFLLTPGFLLAAFDVLATRARRRELV